MAAIPYSWHARGAGRRADPPFLTADLGRPPSLPYGGPAVRVRRGLLLLLAASWESLLSATDVLPLIC